MNTALVVLLAGMVAADVLTKEDRTDPLCGAYSLYISLRSLDCDVKSYAEVEQRLGPPAGGGYSMAQLAEVARSYGVETVGVKTTVDNLLRREAPYACIALINGNHFANIAEVEESQVRIISPPKDYWVPRDTLGVLWSGEALLLSVSPLPPEESLKPGWNWIKLSAGCAAVLAFVAIGWMLCRGRRPRDLPASHVR